MLRCVLRILAGAVPVGTKELQIDLRKRWDGVSRPSVPLALVQQGTGIPAQSMRAQFLVVDYHRLQ